MSEEFRGTYTSNHKFSDNLSLKTIEEAIRLIKKEKTVFRFVPYGIKVMKGNYLPLMGATA